MSACHMSNVLFRVTYRDSIYSFGLRSRFLAKIRVVTTQTDNGFDDLGLSQDNKCGGSKMFHSISPESGVIVK
jgi:hypothetical protein